jgi:hypothetical protein
MIKLPSVTAEMRTVMLEWYFAYVERVITKRMTGSDLSDATRLIRAVETRHGVKLTLADIENGHQRFRTRSFVIDETFYGVPVDITVAMRLIFDKDEKLGRSGGMYDEDDGPFIRLSPFNLRMTGPSIGTLDSLKASLSKVPMLIKMLEHELTHLVQYQSLHYKHGKQTRMHSDYEAESDDYNLSDIEFDPLIKSAVGRLKHLQAKYKTIPGYTERALTDAYVLAADPPEWMNPADTSNFFDTLYNRAPMKWKKAVKLFMHELSVS